MYRQNTKKWILKIDMAANVTKDAIKKLCY